MFARLSRPSTSLSAVARRSFAQTPSWFAIHHDASAEVFSSEVLAKKDKVVLVDFYADWCRPLLQPILNKVAGNEENNVDLVTVDTEKLEDLAQKYEIRSLPTVFAFKNGEVVDKFIGLRKEKEIIKFVTDLQ